MERRAVWVQFQIILLRFLIGLPLKKGKNAVEGLKMGFSAFCPILLKLLFENLSMFHVKHSVVIIV